MDREAISPDEKADPFPVAVFVAAADGTLSPIADWAGLGLAEAVRRVMTELPAERRGRAYVRSLVKLYGPHEIAALFRDLPRGRP